MEHRKIKNRMFVFILQIDVDNHGSFSSIFANVTHGRSFLFSYDTILFAHNKGRPVTMLLAIGGYLWVNICQTFIQ